MKKPQKKTKKAWAVIYNTGEIIERCRVYGGAVWLDTPDGLMIFAQKEQSPSPEYTIPCTITYSIPAKKKK